MFAKVTSLLALVIALGGVAWAATLPEKSVGTKQLKPEAVTTPKVAPGTHAKLACLPSKPGCRGPAGLGAVAFRRIAISPSAEPGRPLASVGPYQLTYRCHEPNSDTIEAEIGVQGPAGFVQTTENRFATSDPTQGSPFVYSTRVLGASVPTTSLVYIDGEGDNAGRNHGTAIIDRAPGTIVHVDFALIADKKTRLCQFYGEGYLAN